jgi:hypothetical protein
VPLSLSRGRPLSFAVLWLLSTPPLEQPAVESLLVRVLNPVDGLAVVQEEDGDMRTVRVGDTAFGSFKITKVLEDRLVAEGVLDSGIKAKLWIYKASPSDESSRVVVLEGRTKPERRASPRKEPR